MIYIILSERGEVMNLDQRLIELRKAKHLSQEEVAEKLNVTRQTISKWETNQSSPEFDKILPLCELFEISTDELITGKNNKINNSEDEILNSNDNKKNRTIGLTIGILLYFSLKKLAALALAVLQAITIACAPLSIKFFVILSAISITSLSVFSPYGLLIESL